jgi:hypothetical protein
MANKIKLTITLSVSGSNVSASMGGSTVIDQQGQNFTHETQVIGTSAAELLDVGTDIADTKMGYLVVRNLEQLPSGTKITDGNVVKLYSDSAATKEIGQVYPGQGVFVGPPALTNAVYAKATLGNALIEFLAVEL